MPLTNSQYDEIMNIYHQRQFRTNDILTDRTAKVIRDIPEYKECQDRISSISVSAAKAKLKGDNSLLAGLTSEIARIESHMKELLYDNGYSSDYLTPSYVCADCKDTGYIDSRKCHCFKQAEIDLLYRQSNIQDVLQRENFDNFDYSLFPDTYRDPQSGRTPLENIKLVVRECKDFVENFPLGENLLFFGEPGVGKTFLTNCIAKEILDSSNSVLYLSAIELFDYFSSKNEYFDNSALDNSAFSMQIIESDLLIIDDLGTELINSFTNSKLFYCINQRLLNNRSTIISTNLTLPQLMDAYSERIFSRISSSYKVIRMFGDDIRLTNK